MIDSSAIAGTYAPPAVQDPMTTAIWGIPLEDIVAWLKNILEQMKIIDNLFFTGIKMSNVLPSKMITVREYFGLSRKIGSARVDEVDTGKIVLSSHILGTQVFLHGDGVVAAALHRSIVCQYHTLQTTRNIGLCKMQPSMNIDMIDHPPSDSTDAGDNTSRRHLLLTVQFVAG